MSVYSNPAEASAAAGAPQAAPEFPRHVVTAVLVSHDGERWLPDALSGLVGQTRAVQNVIAADTGSGDGSARLVTDALGTERVLHMARRTGFGAAVDEAARTAGVLTPDDLPYLKRPSGWDPATRTWRDDAYEMPELPHGEPVQWLWLLHDDCAPAPDALRELLRVVEEQPLPGDGEIAVVGPKLRGWYDRRQLLEAGVSIANSGRRWTGIERREQDQGQHDQIRQVLSVSTAGMLIRRDVFEQLGGFDRRLPLMRDDVDLCWRAQSAGYRVAVVPNAVLRHAEASARERRPVDCAGRGTASPHRVDKAGAVYTLLVNAPAKALPWVMLRVLVGTLMRTLAYLVGKVPGQALDEVSGLMGVLLRPERIVAGRRRRRRPQVEFPQLRPLFPPPGATVRATAEQVAGSLQGKDEPERSSGGRHGAVESGPGDEDADFLEVEQFARLKQVAAKPAPMLFAVLLLVSLVACRGLLGGGSLAGGALLPVSGEVSELWGRFADAWHPLGVGGTQSGPPYLAVVAGLAVLLFGSTGTALTVLLVCSVPLAGLSAYFASRPLVGSRLIRAAGAVAYAFLPATTGALAGGRIGTAVLAILLPLLARLAVASSGLRLDADSRPSWRACWCYAVLLTVATAFTPLVWPVALLLALAVLVLRWRQGRFLKAYALRFAAVLGTPLVLLAPWSWKLLTSPSAFLVEAGLEYGEGASALQLLTLSPGGPGTPGAWLLVGLLLAGLAALLRRDRVQVLYGAWAVALVGLLFAALSNGGGWAGPASLVYGLALLCAAAVGAEGARGRVAARSFGWRQPTAALLAALALAAPLVSAVGWMVRGAGDPLSRRDPVQVPAFVAEESKTRDQARTLILNGDEGSVSYSLLRGSGARLGDADLARDGGDSGRLGRAVAQLVAGSGADQTRQLGDFAVRYVLVRDDAPRRMSRVLDATPGLTRLSQEDGSALWRVDREVSRISVVPPGEGMEQGASAAEPTPVAAGPVEAHTRIPGGPKGRTLRIADAADSGWRATLDGQPLRAITVDGWAQGFELPAEGGRLDLTYQTPLSHSVWRWTQGFLVLVAVVLALPGRRRETDDDLPEPETVPAQPVAGEGRRARRLRAQQAADGGEPRPGAGGGTPPPPAEPQAPEPYEVPGPPSDPYAGVPEGVGQEPDHDARYADHGVTHETTRYADQGYGQPSGHDPYAQPEPYPYGTPQGGYQEGYPDVYQGGQQGDPYAVGPQGYDAQTPGAYPDQTGYGYPEGTGYPTGERAGGEQRPGEEEYPYGQHPYGEPPRW
ncbi:glycosyltransferase [Streptomyces sp. NPDC005438]|uniref:glycosyltransferase n=1 Tax=Streptomyces sp. NPDC005438 TaxID=3156880 RepID=UPI0033ADE816